jgi:hypothetical protein
MQHLVPYFKIEIIDQFAMITTSGLWDMEFFNKYEETILEILKTYPYSSIIGIKDLRNWSIPPLDVAEAFNRLNLKVQSIVDFKFAAMLTSPQQMELLYEVVVDFNLPHTEIKSKAFLELRDALNWIKALNYDTTIIPLDYYG